jgi:carbamoyltransferase
MNILSIRDHVDFEKTGFNCGGHDSSISLISNGTIKYFLKEERYSKIKRDGDLKNSFELFIDNVEDEIDYLFMISSYPTTKPFFDKIKSKYKNIKLINPKKNQHHLYHASISFYNSGFDKSLVVVIDSSSGISESVYVAEYPAKFKQIYVAIDKNPIITKSQSLCNIYDTTTRLIGLLSTENGKTMGLSSYGERILSFPKLFDNYTFPTTAIRGVWEVSDDRYHTEIVKQIGKEVPDKIEITEENYQFYANFCKEIQIQTQDAVAKLIEKVSKKTNITNICISGGYGMNVVSNYNLIKKFPNLNFYFEPLCDDGGISMGSAMYYYRKLTGDKTIYPIKTTSIHGFKYDINEYRGVTKNISDVAKLLYDNKSIGVYSSLSESGQRALGNRSIFFNPLNPNAKEIVNRIKKREWYRPFAASVLEEDASLYFDMGKIKSSPYMTVCFPVKTDIIPGVTHADNTCRVQTVSSGHLYDLLLEFKKISGHGILLNTSFNLAGDPLVESPKDAFKTLNNSFLDYLWFEETEQLFEM